VNDPQHHGSLPVWLPFAEELNCTVRVTSVPCPDTEASSPSDLIDKPETIIDSHRKTP
jgi:hypothetical protein